MQGQHLFDIAAATNTAPHIKNACDDTFHFATIGRLSDVPRENRSEVSTYHHNTSNPNSGFLRDSPRSERREGPRRSSLGRSGRRAITAQLFLSSAVAHYVIRRVSGSVTSTYPLLAQLFTKASRRARTRAHRGAPVSRVRAAACACVLCEARRKCCAISATRIIRERLRFSRARIRMRPSSTPRRVSPCDR